MYYECKFNAFSLFYVRLVEKLFVLQGIFNKSSHLLEQKAYSLDTTLHHNPRNPWQYLFALLHKKAIRPTT